MMDKLKGLGEPETLADKVENRLLDYIRDNRLIPGDQLPYEEELAERIQVGRNILREGLSRLRMLGIVQTRRKRGMRIAVPHAFSGLGRVLRSGLLGGQAQAIIEMRLMLETGVAPFITARITPEGLDELRAVVRAEETATNESERIAADIRFHSIIYREAGNPYLLELQEMLAPFFGYVTEFPPATAEHTVRAGHVDLLAALEARDAGRYSQAIMSHLSLHFPQQENNTPG